MSATHAGRRSPGPRPARARVRRGSGSGATLRRLGQGPEVWVLSLVTLLCLLAVLAGAGSPGFPLVASAGRAVGAWSQGPTPGPGPGPDPTPGSGGLGVGAAAAATVAGVRASAAAIADIPSAYLGYYVRAAASCPGLSWQLLAGIGKVESDHGRSTAPGVRAGRNRFGCCAGPMQFNLVNGPPSTWAGWSRPGDSVYDPADAIPAAARKLCHDGLGPGRFAARWAGKPGADPCPQVAGSAAAHRALRRYNNACWYAHQVLTIAGRYTLRVGVGAAAGPDPSADPFVRALLANPRLVTTESHGCGVRGDLASGRLDVRVQSLLAALVARWSVRVSCVASGHSYFVAGTRRVSNHTVWRAVDVDRVDGRPVSASSRSARALVGWLDRLDGPLRPAEIGSPFAEFADRPVFFTNESHQRHIHIGYGATWQDAVFTPTDR